MSYPVSEEKIKADLLRTFSPQAIPEKLSDFPHYIHVDVDSEGNHLGTITFRVEEQIDNKKHLVITSIISHSDNFIKESIDKYKELCKQNNINKIRIHSSKKAIWRIIRNLDFNIMETVYTCEVQ